MTQLAIEALLRQKIGLEANSIGSSTILRSVRRRMADCGLSDIETYLTRLRTSSEELQELIELVTIPETWFFRDTEPFVFLGRYVISEWLPKHRDGVLRVLSVPCATGEEPYSIALALMEAGLSSNKFRIDAVDISKNGLKKAQRAVYDKYSFRGGNLHLRDRYFHSTTNGFELYESIKSTVNFTYGNLLDPLFLADKVPYDVIYCRNLLIYFDSTAKERAIRVLDRLLTKEGLLFVGHSETGQILGERFVSVQHPLAFAYRKLREQGSKGAGIASERIAECQFPIPNSPFPIPHSPFPIPNSPFPIPNSPLETARSLADRGELHEAATLCETYLSQNRISAEAYLLLGEVRQAMGNEEQAEQCFNKAIYLEPDRYEALMHLALLKERRGDIAGATVIRQRIQRLHQDRL